MASVQSSSYSGRYLKLTVNETSTSVANNTSTLTWTLESIGENSTYYTIYNCSVVVNGQTVYNSGTTTWSSGKFPAKTGSTSGTITVGHKSDGTADPVSFTLHGKVYYSGDDNVSGSVGLSTIPRYASITQFDLAKRSESSVTFTWSASKACDSVQYSINNGAWVSGVYPTTTITGLSPNTSYNIKIRVKATDSQLWTESTTKSITTFKAPTHSLSSKTETSITINWSADGTIDGVWYSIDNGSNWTWVKDPRATSGSYTISGLTNNKSYNIKTRLKRLASQTSYDISSLAISTYDYPYCTDSPNFIIGNKLTLKFYNPLSRSIKFYIISNGTEIANNWTINTTSYTGVDAETSQNQLYATIPNAQSGKYKVKVVYGNITRTRDNGNTVSVKGTETPTFSNFTYKDTNTAVTGVTGNDQILVKGLSNLSVTISSSNKMVAQKSATEKSYTASIDTLSKSANYSANDVTIAVGTVVNSGTKRLNITAFDSRNLSKVAYKDITIMEYAKPVINVSISRLNNFENQTTLKVNGTYTRLTISNTDKNTITKVQYRYRETGGTWGNWTTLNTTITAGKFSCSDVILSLDNTKAFEFEIQAIDKLQTNTKNNTVAVGKAIFLVSSNKRACYINGDELIMYDVVDTW